MATFKAALAAEGVPARYQEKGVFAVVSTFEANAVAADDVIEMLKVQGGVTVVDLVLFHDDMSSGSSAVEIGDGGDVERFVPSTSTSTAAGAIRMTKFPHKYTADDTIDIKVKTGAATGTLTLVVYMTAEEVVLA
jgi:hypothetical protein